MTDRVAQTIDGFCDYFGATCIEGWAYDISTPGDPLVMELCIDGVSVDQVRCDLLREDVIAAGLSVDRVGFCVALPSFVLDGSQHVIEFHNLDGSVISLKTAEGTRQSWVFPQAAGYPEISDEVPIVVGSLDEIQDSGVHGWAYDPDEPDVPVVLHVLVDGLFVESILCNLERPDVMSAGHLTSSVGFNFKIPHQYLDGCSHILEICPPTDRLKRLRFAAYEGPVMKEFKFPRFVAVGQVDGLRNGAVRGWAFVFDRVANAKMGGQQILVSIQGHPVAQIVAREFRADVASAHASDPNCGFSFFPPSKMVAGRTVEFQFKIIPGGHLLAGSPALINFPSMETVEIIQNITAEVDQLFTKMWLLRDRLRKLSPNETYTIENYNIWAQQYQKYLAAAPGQLDKLLPVDAPAPLVSVICPIYKPRIHDFLAAVESVRGQTYPYWELILVDDASGSAELTKNISEFSKADSRIKSITLKKNSGISGATNVAIDHAKGDYIALFDHDDLLVSRALEFMLAAALKTGAGMLYSDEDKIDDDGIFSEPNFKPDWNYRLLLAQNYVCHLLLVRRDYFEKVGPFRKECDGAQDHDIIIRLSEVIPHDQIAHVPEVLYHWRKTPMSTAASGKSKTYTVNAGIRAIQDHLDRKKISGKVHSPREITCFEIEWKLNREPKITIIIPYREHVSMTLECLNSIFECTKYNNYDIILVDNWSTSDEALEFAEIMKSRAGITVLRVEEPFNYSRLNNIAVEKSSGELLLFMNNDVFVSDPNWLRAMVGELEADDRVGIVGAKLFYPTGLVQHGGVILGVGGVADHAHKGLTMDDPGYVARAICAQELSAVTAACLLCRRAAFEEVGGFDEHDLMVAFNDVDLCLKVGKAGYRIIWTPNAIAEHRESLSRGDDMRPDQQSRFFHENEIMMTRWKQEISQDRFYHRFFSKKSGIFNDVELNF